MSNNFALLALKDKVDDEKNKAELQKCFDVYTLKDFLQPERLYCFSSAKTV